MILTKYVWSSTTSQAARPFENLLIHSSPLALKSPGNSFPLSSLSILDFIIMGMWLSYIFSVSVSDSVCPSIRLPRGRIGRDRARLSHDTAVNAWSCLAARFATCCRKVPSFQYWNRSSVVFAYWFNWLWPVSISQCTHLAWKMSHSIRLSSSSTFVIIDAKVRPRKQRTKMGESTWLVVSRSIAAPLVGGFFSLKQYVELKRSFGRQNWIREHSHCNWPFHIRLARSCLLYHHLSCSSSSFLFFFFCCASFFFFAIFMSSIFHCSNAGLFPRVNLIRVSFFRRTLLQYAFLQMSLTRSEWPLRQYVRNFEDRVHQAIFPLTYFLLNHDIIFNSTLLWFRKTGWLKQSSAENIEKFWIDSYGIVLRIGSCVLAPVDCKITAWSSGIVHNVT